MRIVDTKGQLCPAPLIAAKKALKEAAAGESFIVLSDNKTSADNLCRFLRDNKAVFTVNESGGIWTLTVTGNAGEPDKRSEDEYCVSSISHFQKGNFIVVISSDKMGEGDEKLGQLLIVNFIMALKDLDNLPQKIIFYNSGVKLASVDSPVIEHLKDLGKMGVELILCSTCVDHYSLGSSVGAGTVSNMYAIAGMMASSANIVKP